MSYNIKKNSEPISEKEITEKKDFDRFLKEKNTSPLSSRRGAGGEVGKWVMVTIGTAALVGVIIMVSNDNDVVEQSLSPVLTEKTIRPNLSGVDIQKTVFYADAGKPETYTHPNGSKIIIPEGAFLDEKGKPVKGKVKLTYREFHTPEDIFLSGIPMTYDSAGTQYHFESAGMLEILAYQDDKPVFANPEKPIRIEMASTQPGDHYNKYFLDPKDQNWKFLGKDSAGVPDNWSKELDSLLDIMPPEKVAEYISRKLNDAWNEKIKVDLKKPPFPKKAEKGKFLFNIDVDSAQFPEIAKFKNVKFEVSSKNKDFKPEKANKTWRSVKLTRIDSTNEYKILFTDWKEKYTVIAVPALEGDDYDKAKLEFDKKYVTYNKESDAKQKEILKRNNQLSKLNELYGTQVDLENRDQSAVLLNNAGRQSTTDIVFRVFYADNFGIYNCDCPKMLPKGCDVVAKFCDSTGKALDLQTIYLVEKGKNQMYTYYPRNLNSFKYNPNRQNMVWSVTKDNRLVTIMPDNFKKVKPKKDTCVYRMKIIDTKIASEGYARTCLNMW